MMKIMRYLIPFVFALACLVVQPYTANAQYAPAPQELFEDENTPAEEPEQIQPDRPTLPEPANPDVKPLPFETYDQIPQEALDDAHDFYKTCQSDLQMPTHYNCECWSQRYLEERIIAGPNVPRQMIMIRISRECFDLPAAAGYAHKRCQENGMSVYNGGMSPDEFCECIGNNYALLLEQTPSFQLSGKGTGALYSSASLRCRKTQPGVPDIFPRLDE